jgi:hypothetical protein
MIDLNFHALGYLDRKSALAYDRDHTTGQAAARA